MTSSELSTYLAIFIWEWFWKTNWNILIKPNWFTKEFFLPAVGRLFSSSIHFFRSVNMNKDKNILDCSLVRGSSVWIVITMKGNNLPGLLVSLTLTWLSFLIDLYHELVMNVMIKCECNIFIISHTETQKRRNINKPSRKLVINKTTEDFQCSFQR